MADIFDTSISEGRTIQQDAGNPFINPQSRAAGAEINAADAYSLAAGRRVDQLAEIAEAKAEARRRELQLKREQKAAMKEQAKGLNSLSGLTEGLINRYNSIDLKVKNPIERNRLKREADLLALTSGGKENASYLNGIIEKLNTSYEARDDGMVNVLDSQGRVVRVEAGSKDEVIQGRMNKYQRTVDEVLPNTLDSMNLLLQKDAATTGYFRDDSIAKMLTSLKNESGRMKRISDEYHVQSNLVPSKELPKLKENAARGYVSAAAGIFGTFTSPEMLQAIRAGNGISLADVEMSMQQVRRDIIDEIASQKVPINIQDVESYIKTSMENVRNTYKSIQDNELLPLETAEKKARLLNDLQKENVRMAGNIPNIEVMKPVVDFFATISAAGSNLYNTAAMAEDEDTRNKLLAQGDFLTSLGDDLMEVNKNIAGTFRQGAYNMDTFRKQASKATERQDILDALNVLSRTTNTPGGAFLAPQINALLVEAIPKLEEWVDSGELEESELDGIVTQVTQYNNNANDQIKKTGMTPEEYVKSSQSAFTLNGAFEAALQLPAPQLAGAALLYQWWRSRKATKKSDGETNTPAPAKKDSKKQRKQSSQKE